MRDDRIRDWLIRQLSQPNPPCMAGWDRLLDRVPVWSLPLVIVGAEMLLAAAVVYLAREILR